MLLGITATREGATLPQLESLLWLLTAPGVEVAELHHGDCLGGDEDADTLACGLGIPRVSHPPDNPKLRAYCRSERVLPPAAYKQRNKDIVLATCPLVGMPKSAAEERWGGTWGTIRLARSFRLPVAVIRPDGSLSLSGGAGRFWGLGDGELPVVPGLCDVAPDRGRLCDAGALL